MDTVLLLVRLVLAGVFGLAGVAKLADLDGSREAMGNFGVPSRLAGPAGLALPLVELAIAVLLLPLATAWWAALAALALLLTFIAGITYNLRQGRRPDCHCFGQVYSAPIGRGTLMRNGIFAALAAILVLSGPNTQGSSLVGWVGDLSTAERVLAGGEVLLLAGLGALFWLVVQLLQQQGRLQVRLEAVETNPAAVARPPLPEIGLPIGTPAPAFALAAVDGGRVSLDDLRSADRPTLLIFADADCGPCQALMPEIAGWQRDHADAVTIAVISRSTMAATAARAREHGLAHVLVQQDHEVASAYASLPTPSAVLVRADGTIGSQGAAGPDAVRTLVAHLLGTPMPGTPMTGAPTPGPTAMPEPNGNGARPLPVLSANGNGTQPVPTPMPAPSRIGQPAPDIELPDLAGEQVRLADFRGEEVLVLFWGPDCGFCQRMLGDLQAWEASPPAGAPRLLVVSRGDVESNRAMGLRSPVVLDPSLAAGRSFGTHGTPAAVLVDAEGRIASDVAAGKTAVLGLLQRAPVETRPV